MDKNKIKEIIKTTVNKGSKHPGLLGLSKAYSLKVRLEACKDIDEILTNLNKSQKEICDLFGISAEDFNLAIKQITEMKK